MVFKVIYLKGFKFHGHYISWFSLFLTIFAKFWTRVKFQKYNIAKLIPAKLNTCQIWDSLFPNIWSRFDIIATRVSRVYVNNKIWVSYLITITLINDRKKWYSMKLSFLIFTEIAKLNTREIFCNYQISKLDICKM